MKKLIFLYLIIFLEGYVVLSAELLAIRQVIPFVGSGTDTVSIIIAAVLMPLAIGYYAGGKFKQNQKGKKNPLTVRRKLQKNILISAIFLALGLSYIIISTFFETLNELGIRNRLLATTLYSIIFLITPVFLLAQTIPLVSNFFRKENLSLITGKMLSFSTVGSFLGATFSTLVLMATLGVHHTTSITILCLCALYIALSKKKISEGVLIIIAIGSFSLFINSDNFMKELHVVENNQYNVIRVLEGKKGQHLLSLNNNNSSSYIINPAAPDKKQTTSYVKYIGRNFIRPTLSKDQPVRSILVIGAGGFTIGLNDHKNDYIFIDIDGSLKDVAEKHFLKQKLGKNKHFEAIPARAYLHQIKQSGKKFDLIILDAYLGARTIPEHLVTKEFFKSAKDALKENGIIIANFLISIGFNNAFSVNLDNTLHHVFPNITRQIMPATYDGWSDTPDNNRNILYIYHNKRHQEDGFYTDNKNRVYYDKNKPVK